MKNELEGTKYGAWMWSIANGWNRSKSSGIVEFPITCGGISYNLNGQRLLSLAEHVSEKYQSLFLEPPECFNAEPKPCEFKKGDRVLVCQSYNNICKRRYFSHIEKGFYYCFFDGATEWSAKGNNRACVPWKYCKKAENS